MIKNLLLSIVLVAFSTACFAAPQLDLWGFWQQSDEANIKTIDHSSWQKILDRYLYDDRNGVNLFDYASVTSEAKAELDHYLSAMQAIDPREYKSVEQKAYWINLYNALTVDLILANYPVESITKLGKGFFKFGPWDDTVAKVAGQNLTLNDIEHRILRPIWPDPRIHFAVNCASIGCPDLQAEAYTSGNIDALMDRAANDYLSHSRAVDFQTDGRLKLSSIFDWYADDFGRNQAEVLTTLARYAPSETAERLRAYSGKISYDYSWELNEYNGELGQLSR